MRLFNNNNTRTVFDSRVNKLKDNIEMLTNEQICNTDLDELEEYYEDKYIVEEINLYLDNIENELTETKIKEYNHFYRDGYNYEPKYYQIGGYKVIFKIPFEGEEDLLYLQPSSFYLQNFSVDSIISPTSDAYGTIIYSIDFKKSELEEQEDVQKFVKSKFDNEFKNYIETINRINSEVTSYNNSLKNTINNLLKKRLKKASDYFDLRKKLNIPLNSKDTAPNTKPVLLKKVKKNKERSFPKQKCKENEYTISDSDYINIKNIINLACVSMEKSARTFNRFLEEELRDIILSNLNSHYQGTATGETFNKIGKTDIHIPFENKSAYIGECKIWHGTKKFNEAIEQLFGYTTWRDTKTSLIIFNKDNRDFKNILKSIDEALSNSDLCKTKIKVNQNEWQCKFIKALDVNEEIEVHICVYDLYIK